MEKRLLTAPSAEEAAPLSQVRPRARSRPTG